MRKISEVKSLVGAKENNGKKKKIDTKKKFKANDARCSTAA